MDSHCVGLPGAFNGLVARAVVQAGREGAYGSGAAVTAAFGVPDIGRLTLNEFCSVIRQVTVTIPWSVNLTALPMTLTRTCRRRVGSPRTREGTSVAQLVCS